MATGVRGYNLLSIVLGSDVAWTECSKKVDVLCDVGLIPDPQLRGRARIVPKILPGSVLHWLPSGGGTSFGLSVMTDHH